MATEDLFYCSAPQGDIPKDVLKKVLVTTLTNQAWEYFNTADVASNLYAANLMDYSDFEYYTNSLVSMKTRKNQLLLTHLPSKGNQKRTLFLFCQCLAQERPTMHLAHELRTTALEICGVETTHGIPELSNIDTNLQEMITSLQGKSVPVDLAKLFADSLGLTSNDLGDNISTNLGELAGVWVRNNSETCTPQRLVEALICTKGLGKYASGITVLTNEKEIKSFLCNLGNDWWKVVEFLGFSRAEVERSFSPRCRNSVNSCTRQVSEFLSSLFRLPNCGVHTMSILTMLAQKAEVSIQKLSASEPMLTPYLYDEPRLKPSHFAMPPGHQFPIQPWSLSSGSLPTSTGAASFNASPIVIPVIGPPMPPWAMGMPQQMQTPSAGFELKGMLERLSAQLQYLTQTSFGQPSHGTEPTVKNDKMHSPSNSLKDGHSGHGTQDSDDSARFKRDNSADIIQQCKKGDSVAVEIIEALLDSGNDPTRYISEENGSHPLHLAVLSKSFQLLSTLVGFYSTQDLINVTNDDQQTALMLACKEKIHDHVRLLLDHHADPNALDKNGLSCLHMRETLEMADIVQLLLDKGARVDIPSEGNKLTPLTHACFLGEFKSVDILLSAGANPNGLPQSASSPLCAAAQGGHRNIVQKLLACDQSVDINYLDWENCSPLLRACRGGHTDVVSTLVNKDADINQSDKNGNTPVLAAVEGSHLELLQMLIAFNADVNKGKFVELKDSSEVSSIEVTPLALAAGKGNLAMVQSLVEGKANVNFVHARAPSALSHAVAQEHEDVVEYLLKVNDFIATIDTLQFPLKRAADVGNLAIIQLLLDALGGVEKALNDATQNEHSDLVDIICEYNDKVKEHQVVSRIASSETTSELAPISPTSPSRDNRHQRRPRLRTFSQKDIQASLEETLNLFVKVAMDTAVKKQGKEFILQKAKEKQFHHLSAFFDKFFSTPENIEGLFGEFVNVIPFPSPAYFIFEDEELFDGETFQETLSQVEKNPVEFLPVALLQIPDLDEMKLDGDGLIRLLMGSRFADAVERLKLLNVSEPERSTEEHKPWVSDLVRSCQRVSNCSYERGQNTTTPHAQNDTQEHEPLELHPPAIEQQDRNRIVQELKTQDEEAANTHVQVTTQLSSNDDHVPHDQQSESATQVFEGSTPQRQVWQKSMMKCQHTSGAKLRKSNIPRLISKRISKSVCGYRFESKVITSSPNTSCLFRELAERIVNWRSLAICLNLDDTTVASICRQYEFDKERCYHVLQYWKDSTPTADTRYIVLARTLVEIKQEPLVAIVHKFMNGIDEHDNRGELKPCEEWSHKVSPSSSSTKFLCIVAQKCVEMEQSGYKAAEVTVRFIR